mgnify:CR=1 FL=1
METGQQGTPVPVAKGWLRVSHRELDPALSLPYRPYHTTMPTDALTRLRDVMLETRSYGFDKVRQEQFEIGRQVRLLLESRGFKSVAAEGFKAPGVVVSYTKDPEIHNSKKFLALGLQTAAGVPLQCDEPKDFMTFRIGLFGLDKWHQPERSVKHLAQALDTLGYTRKAA